jgi:hypothetical protein
MRSVFALPIVVAACVTHAPGTAPGDRVYGGAVESVVLEDRGGGFVPTPPPGPCDPQVASYTATVASHELAWSTCIVVGTGADARTQTRSGHRVLTPAEWSTLEGALGKLVVVRNDGSCGADKPTDALIVMTATDTIEYADSFYACQNKDKPLVDSDLLDQALATAGQLAQ